MQYKIQDIHALNINIIKKNTSMHAKHIFKLVTYIRSKS